MENIKLGRLDETGDTINDVEKALARVNIPLRENETTFREMDDVLEDVAKKWATFDDVTRASITGALAGTRQANILIALLDNWTMVQKLLGEQMKSNGLAAERYQIYLDNAEAASNRFRVAWEQLATGITNSDTVIWLTNVGTNILKLIDYVGELQVVLVALFAFLSRKLIIKAIVGALEVLGVQLVLTTNLAGATSIAIGGLTLSLTALQVVTGAIVFTAIIGGLWMLKNAVEAADKSMVEWRDHLVSEGDTFEENQAELDRLIERYETLSKQTTLTKEDQKELLDIVTTLNTKYDMVTSGIDLYTTALRGNNVAQAEAIELMKEKQIQEAKEFMALNTRAIGEAKDWVGKEQAYLAGPWWAHGSAEGVEANTLYGTPQEILDQLAVLASQEKDMTGIYHQQYEELKNQLAAYQEIVDKAKYYKDILNDTLNPQGASLDRTALLMMQQYAGVTEIASEETQNFSDAIKDLQVQVSGALGIYKDFISAQELSVDQIFKIIETYENYTELLIVENGQITLNTHALRLMTLAKIDDQIATLENQKIEGQLNVELVKRIAILQALRGEVVNSFNEIASARAEEERAASRSQEAEIRAKAAEIQEKAYQDLLKMTIDMLRQKKQAEIDALEAKLDAYKDIIDAEKRLLELKDEEYKYDKEKAEKNKTIADLEGELAELQFDDSQEATAKRLELEQQLAEAKDDLNELEHDRSVELSEDALDQEYSQYEEFINKKIDKLERYLSESGTITRDAMALLSSQSEALYQSLIEWNRQFGSGIDEDVVGAWQRAFNAMVAYAAAAQQISANTSFSTGTGGTPYSTGDQGNLTGKTIKLDNAYGTDVNVYGSSGATTPIDNIQEGRRYTVLDYDEGAKNPYKIRAEIDGRMQDVWVRSRNANFETYHTGLDAGAVGGIESKFGEVFVKALKGEYFVTPPQVKNFVTNVMPKSFEAMLSQAGGLQIDKLMEINVNGGVLDKSVMPDLESLADKVMNRLNTITAKRGHFRNANSYSV